MQHSIWKLTALVGISGFGFLALLQVQKSLHDGGTVQAAELDPVAAAKEAARKSSASRPAPGKVRLKLEPVPVTSAARPAGAASPGLDFRRQIPTGTTASNPPGLFRTADVELKPIPSRNRVAAGANDPFAAIRPEVSVAAAKDEPLPVIRPAGFEEPADSEPAAVEPTGAKSPPPASNASDFGPDPFGDLVPLEPDPAAAELEDRPAPIDSESPSELLDGDDPFAAASDEPAAAEELSSPAEEPAAADSADLPVEGASVPIDGGPSGADASPFGDAVGDDPFGAAPSPAESAPIEPASVEEPTEDPFGDAASDPFGDVSPEPVPSDAAPASESDQPAPQTSPDEEGFDFEADPVPVEEPSPSTEADFDLEPSPETPADEARADETSPPAESPRLLPASGEGELKGVGIVTPDSPRGPQRAELTVEKRAPETASLGQPLVYEIAVKNVGDSPAHEVTVSDVVPKGTTLQGTIPRAEIAGKMLVWKLDTLQPGESKAIKVKVTPIEAGSIGSVATVNFVSEVAAETQVIAPRLTLKIDAPPEVALGQPVDIRFEIANEGNGPAHEVLLRDVLPEGFKHADGNDLEYEVGTLAPGKEEAVTLRVAAVKPGSYTNTAVITALGGLKAEATASVEIADRKVSVTRQGPKRRYVGRPAMYANVVKNGSDATVRAVKVIEQVPPGMEFVQASHGGQFDADNRTIAWQVGPLRPGQEQTLQVVLTAAVEGVQDSVVRIEESDGGEIALTSSTTVTGTPSLAPTMQGPRGPVVVGERAAFRITVRNRGTAPAENVTASLALPAQLTFLEARGGTAETDATGRAIVRLAEPLPPGGEQVIDFVIEGAAAGTARLRAEVHAAHMAKPLVRDEEMTVVVPGA